MAWNNRQRGGNQGGGHNYLRSSSLKINTIFNGDLDENGKDKKEPFPLDFDTTHEVSITLTPEKAQDLINRVAAAMDDPQGTGGIRMSMYCKKSQNQNTGEEFDGMGILIYAQRPAQNGFQGRGRGSFQGRQGGGGGRRSYPSQRTQGQGQPQQNGGRQWQGNDGPGQNEQQPTQQQAAPAASTRRGPAANSSSQPSRAPARAPARQAAPPPPAETEQSGPPTPEDCPI